ncbi:MAG TPA: homocysteine S-methyltransferase family protein [Acidimicrobiales bacterium]
MKTHHDHHALPQMTGDRTFLTDGGLETSLIFHDGMDLPAFASFPLLFTEEGRARLVAYYEQYLATARDHGMGFVLEGVTWRASRDWADELGLTDADLLRAIDASSELMAGLRDRWQATVPVVVSACIGPRGDGYAPDGHMTATEAEAYHAFEIRRMAEGAIDQVSAFTITYVDEAVGITAAAARVGIPVAISFTVETDGRLPDGTSLGDAIDATDAATGGYPAYYMVNCAHPTHVVPGLEKGAPWTARIQGLRANASTLSHAELDESETLEDGDPVDLGRRYVDLHETLPGLRVLGGCCGTDHRHVEAIAGAWTGAGRTATTSLV